MKLQYLPNTNLLFIPPLAGFFFAYMDVGTSREAWMPGATSSRYHKMEKRKPGAMPSLPHSKLKEYR
jgi:hypothetical protein